MNQKITGCWQGQVILITGASAGIGAALAEQMLREGAKVALAARRLDRLEALAGRLNQVGEGEEGDKLAIPLICDVTDQASVKRCIESVIEQWGRLDVVVANAGFGVTGTIERLTTDDYQRQFDTNVFGVINTLKVALPQLSEHQGRAVIIGSVNGHVALAANSAYAMSKFAVRALAQSLWVEWLKRGISVTLIEPGFVDSEIRKVNNKGVYREHAKDPVPSWLIMPAPKAAKQISRAIFKRKRQAVITGHGKLIVWLARHCPWLIYLALKRVRGRSSTP